MLFWGICWSVLASAGLGGVEGFLGGSTGFFAGGGGTFGASAFGFGGEDSFHFMTVGIDEDLGVSVGLFS
jgi:hypothetical protein